MSNFRSINASEKDPTALASVLQNAMRGKLNAIKTAVTLTASSATTTLTDTRIGPESVIVFMPTTANAKAEGMPYVTGRGDGTCTLNHANNAQSDRTYDIAIFG